MIRHVGERPKNDISTIKKRGRYYYLEEETGRVWTSRELSSGCGAIVKEISELRGLIYCPWCKEYFNKKQYVEVERGE